MSTNFILNIQTSRSYTKSQFFHIIKSQKDDNNINIDNNINNIDNNINNKMKHDEGG